MDVQEALQRLTSRACLRAWLEGDWNQNWNTRHQLHAGTYFPTVTNELSCPNVLPHLRLPLISAPSSLLP